MTEVAPSRDVYGSKARELIKLLADAFPFSGVQSGRSKDLTIDEQCDYISTMLRTGNPGELGLVCVPNPDFKEDVDAYPFLILAITGNGPKAAGLADFFASAPGAIRCLLEQLGYAKEIFEGLLDVDENDGVERTLSIAMRKRIETWLSPDKPAEQSEIWNGPPSGRIA